MEIIVVDVALGAAWRTAGSFGHKSHQRFKEAAFSNLPPIYGGIWKGMR
jgi:hypothetical protein